MSNFFKCLVMVLSLLCNTDKYADLCLDVNMLDGDIIFLLLMEVEAVVVDPYSGPAAIPSLFAGVIPGSRCRRRQCTSAPTLAGVHTRNRCAHSVEPVRNAYGRVRSCWSEKRDHRYIAAA